MKIGIDAFVFRFPATGIVNYTYQLVKHLIRNFSENDYRLFVDDPTFSMEEMKDFRKGAAFIEVQSGFSRENTGMNRCFSAFRRRVLPRLLPDYNIFHATFPLMEKRLRLLTSGLDVYHCIDWYLYPSPKSKKNVLTAFDLTTTLFPQFHDELCVVKEKIKKSLIKEFDNIIAISDSTKHDLIDYHGIDPGKIETIHPSVDGIFDSSQFEDKDTICRKYNIPADTPYFLTVSTIEPRKNFIVALDSFKLFSERNKNQKIRLVCTGMWGWKNDDLKKYLDTYPFKDRLVFTGFAPLEDLPSLYHYSAGFLYLSLYEGFGLPVLEAMKTKTPVICSNTSSIPEVIGDCGELVSPKNIEQIADSMEKLIFQEGYANILRGKAYERGKTFSWEKTARKIMEVYKS